MLVQLVLTRYLAQQAIAQRHKKGLFKNLTYDECVERYIQSINNGLLKIMSKMGISVVSSYRGGCNFEAIGLSRNLMSEYFPSMSSKLSGMGLSGITKTFIKCSSQGISRRCSESVYRRIL